jgi:hypothetical protein
LPASRGDEEVGTMDLLETRAPYASQASETGPLSGLNVAHEAERASRSIENKRPNPNASARLLALSILISVVAFATLILGQHFKARVPIFLLGVLLASVSAVGGIIRGTATLVRSTRPRRGWMILGVVAAVLGNLLMTGFGSIIAWFATVGFARGRQLRRWGRILLPRSERGHAWARVPLEALGEEPLPEGLALAWRENGKTEHASVAAFARLTLDLMALGAPPLLVASSNQDALDEIRHTELCFSLARSIDGKAESPAPFPEAQRVSTLPRARTTALAKLAVDSLIDGALYEGLSARVVAKLAKRCNVPAIRAILREIAADEGRHAAHGWDVVAWCLTEGGGAVAHALRGALRSIPETVRSPLPEAARGGAWERWGIHGSRLEQEEYVLARQHLVSRLTAMTQAALKAA